MSIADIAIDFTFERGDPGDSYEDRLDFWGAPKTVQWFESRGYTLYREFGEPGDGYSTVPRLPSLDSGEATYPYAAPNIKQVAGSFSAPLNAVDTWGKVAFAQDSQHRHVAIKIVRGNTDEHRILEFLKQQPLEILKENCVIPVLDIIPIDGFFFVVMPRWGSAINCPGLASMREVLQMMHAMLKGLDFLHRHNIVHGDIALQNFLIDDFADYLLLHNNNFRARRRAEGKTLYCIFDFDFSMKLPEETDRKEYWISNDLAWGSFNVTMDFAQGEPDYNPFITDVGSLGVLFSKHFHQLIPDLPILAPFLDKLTTHRLNDRFTSSEALSFFEEFYSQLTEEKLEQEPRARSLKESVLYYEYDRWAGVSPEFAERWAHYREPPLPWSMAFLRRVCEYRFTTEIVFRVRLYFGRIFKYGRAIVSYFTKDHKISL